MADSRIGVSKTPISPAGPTAADLRLSQSLEETLKSFNMFESGEGMQSRFLLEICYFIYVLSAQVESSN